jgi:hypothetical protein
MHAGGCGGVEEFAPPAQPTVQCPICSGRFEAVCRVAHWPFSWASLDSPQATSFAFDLCCIALPQFLLYIVRCLPLLHTPSPKRFAQIRCFQGRQSKAMTVATIDYSSLRTAGSTCSRLSNRTHPHVREHRRQRPRQGQGQGQGLAAQRCRGSLGASAPYAETGSQR